MHGLAPEGPFAPVRRGCGRGARFLYAPSRAAFIRPCMSLWSDSGVVGTSIFPHRLVRQGRICRGGHPPSRSSALHAAHDHERMQQHVQLLCRAVHPCMLSRVASLTGKRAERGGEHRDAQREPHPRARLQGDSPPRAERQLLLRLHHTERFLPRLSNHPRVPLPHLGAQQEGHSVPRAAGASGGGGARRAHSVHVASPQSDGSRGS